MKRVVFVALSAALTAVAGSAIAEEIPVPSRITSVSLFKNGLAVVQRTLSAAGPGTYRVEDVPEPVHGTFWVESDAKVVTRVARRVVEAPANEAAGGDFQEELAGRQVVVHFAEQGVPAASGTVVQFDPPRGDAAWNRSYEQPVYGYYSGPAGARSPASGRMLVLANDDGRTYVDAARIASLEVKGAVHTVKRRKPIVLFTVSDLKDKAAAISISYLAKGMAWAPSYRVDITDPKTLVLQQTAVVKNELGPIEDARVWLISGFPSVRFANVTSPLSLNTTWTSFFQQLSQRYSEGSPMGGNRVATQQALAFNNAAPTGGADLSAIPTGEGADLHYQDLGRQTLGEGDSLGVETASGKADYERIVEWIVPDTRRDDGQGYAQQPEVADEQQEGVWDAVRFRNPLEFPMTTAPAMVVSGGRFEGQRMSYWTNRGEQTTLHVTKALSIRTRSTERELPDSREFAWVGNHNYRKATVQGELQTNNHRKEAVTLVIRRRFSGELISADQSPKQTLLSEGVLSVNPRNQLLWTLTLKPGEEVKLGFKYNVLVWQ